MFTEDVTFSLTPLIISLFRALLFSSATQPYHNLPLYLLNYGFSASLAIATFALTSNPSLPTQPLVNTFYDFQGVKARIREKIDFV